MIKPNLGQLFNAGDLRVMPKGQIVIYEGDPITNLWYLTEGYVKVYSILETGSERIIFIYSPGDVFPITSYLSGSGITRYFYECMTEVKARRINPEYLRDKVKDNLELGESLIHYADSMNQQFIQRIDMLAAASAKHKIIALLDFLVKKTGSNEPKIGRAHV